MYKSIQIVLILNWDGIYLFISRYMSIILFKIEYINFNSHVMVPTIHKTMRRILQKIFVKVSVDLLFMVIRRYFENVTN